MTFKDLAKRIATCYNSLPALIDALRDGFNEVEAGGGGGSSDIEYSTEEKKIGTWIDGSDVYMRVFDLGSDMTIMPSEFTNTAIDASLIKRLVNVWGVYSTGATTYSLTANINENIIRLQADRNGAPANVRYVIVQYTKTTNTAN